MFTEEEHPIRKYRGDLVDRRSRVKLGVSQHTVPSVPVSGDRRGQTGTRAERAGEKPASKGGSKGTGTGGNSPGQGNREKDYEHRRTREATQNTESDSFRFKAGGKRGAIETAYVPAEIKAYLLRLR